MTGNWESHVIADESANHEIETATNVILLLTVINRNTMKAWVYLKSVAEFKALLIGLSFPVVTFTCFIAGNGITKKARKSFD